MSEGAGAKRTPGCEGADRQAVEAGCAVRFRTALEQATLEQRQTGAPKRRRSGARAAPEQRASGARAAPSTAQERHPSEGRIRAMAEKWRDRSG